MNRIRRAVVTMVYAMAAAASLPAQNSGLWRFAVSGDSRNCGDVVMPAIAAGAAAHHAEFYWHLGDFRAIYDFDQDYRQTHTGRGATIIAYETNAWQDFIDSQLSFFGAMPVYLGIGNHELIPPKTRADFIAQFADWLAAPPIRERRLADDPKDHAIRTWYHWVRDGVDFINLDNASLDQFDSKQLSWAEARVDRAAADPSIRALVIGMHEALPGSLASNHSMDDAPGPQASGAAFYDHILAMHRSIEKTGLHPGQPFALLYGEHLQHRYEPRARRRAARMDRRHRRRGTVRSSGGCGRSRVGRNKRLRLCCGDCGTRRERSRSLRVREDR